MSTKIITRAFSLSILLILLLGCTPSTNGGSTDKLSPPAWIIGSWSTNTGFPSADITCQLTADNFIFSTTGMSINFKVAYSAYSLSDTYSSTFYEITLSAPGTTATYSFSKLTATTLNYTNTANGISVGPLMFTKI